MKQNIHIGNLPTFRMIRWGMEVYCIRLVNFKWQFTYYTE